MNTSTSATMAPGLARSGRAKIDEYLKELVQRNGSDLHLKVGRPPLMRIHGDLLPSEYPIVSRKEMEELLFPLLSDKQRRKLDDERELDFAYFLEGVSQFRASFFYQLGNPGAVLRAIPIDIKTLDELGHPQVLKELILQKQGLILVTGPTGSGKSTTLAALIEFLNSQVDRHVITIEDPIEFIHTDKKCTINQREVGTDTHSFFSALKRALRADPDIILIGEMRDPETIRTALTAAETGHLVLSTLHTNYAKQSVTRIIDAFPPEHQHHIRVRTAMALLATVAQKLVKRSDGTGRTAVLEIMINTPTIKKMIAEEKLDQIDKAIADSAELYKMQTFNQHLFQLIAQNVLTKEDALEVSNNPNDLRIMLQTKVGAQREEPKRSPFGSKPPWVK